MKLAKGWKAAKKDTQTLERLCNRNITIGECIALLEKNNGSEFSIEDVDYLLERCGFRKRIGRY